MGLVANHHGTLPHHALLEDWGYLRQPFTVIWTLLLSPQTGGHEPETHIDKFRLHDQLKSLPLLRLLHQVPGKGKGLVHTALQPLLALCLPHEPQLQTVHTPATLHHLVSRVQSHIVELVLLEEVAGLGPMTALEQVLRRVGGQSDYPPTPRASLQGCSGSLLSSVHMFLSLEPGSTDGMAAGLLKPFLWVFFQHLKEFFPNDPGSL